MYSSVPLSSPFARSARVQAATPPPPNPCPYMYASYTNTHFVCRHVYSNRQTARICTQDIINL